MNDYIRKKIKSTIRNTDTRDVSTIAKINHCKILEIALDKHMLGCTVTNSRCHTIIIHNEMDEHLKNFVILHELGHIKLHAGISTPFFKRVAASCVIPKIEREANEFALGILTSINQLDTPNHYDIVQQLGLPETFVDYLKFQ